MDSETFQEIEKLDHTSKDDWFHKVDKNLERNRSLAGSRANLNEAATS